MPNNKRKRVAPVIDALPPVLAAIVNDYLFIPPKTEDEKMIALIEKRYYDRRLVVPLDRGELIISWTCASWIPIKDKYYKARLTYRTSERKYWKTRSSFLMTDMLPSNAHADGTMMRCIMTLDRSHRRDGIRHLVAPEYIRSMKKMLIKC